MEQPDALVLTGIGIGTAFGVLVLLLAAVFVIRLINWLVGKWTRPGRRARLKTRQTRRCGTAPPPRPWP